MKKLIILLVVIVFAIALISTQVLKPTQKKIYQNKSMTCYIMKSGKVYQFMAGKERLLEKEVILGNGKKILPNGKVILLDGMEITLRNAECIDEKGNFHKSHKFHHKRK